MLHVTPEARIELHTLLTQTLDRRGQPELLADLAFRIVLGSQERGLDGTLGLTLDAPGERDAVVEHQGDSVLILDQLTAELMDDLTLDVVETPEGRQLGLRG
jgi:hypothetical protein